MEVTIQIAAETDYPAILQACIEEGWNGFELRKEDFFRALPHSIVLVSYQDGKFAGFARAISDGSFTTFLCELLVVKAYRHHGIGTQLVQAIHQQVPHARMDLLSDADAFYETLEFRNLGTGYRKSNWKE